MQITKLFANSVNISKTALLSSYNMMQAIQKTSILSNNLLVQNKYFFSDTTNSKTDEKDKIQQKDSKLEELLKKELIESYIEEKKKDEMFSVITKVKEIVQEKQQQILSQNFVLADKTKVIKKQTEVISQLRSNLTVQIEEVNSQISRNERDKEQIKKFALQKFSQNLLEVVDNLEQSLKFLKLDKNTKNSIEGIEMTLSIFLKILKKHGITQINPVNEKFDPNKHEAIAYLANPNAKDNTILDVQAKGYLLYERVIRPPKVVVVKNSE